jgi:O-antigen biosynthesis protein
VIPHTDAPAISVLVVMYGGGALAVDAVASLVEHTEQPFEVIVVDNASPDDSVAEIREGITGLTLITEERNLGFGGGNNRAARNAQAPVICMLNPDARVTAGWLEPLLAALEDPKVGAVAPALIGPNGELQEVGAMVDHWGIHRPDRHPWIRPARCDAIRASSGRLRLGGVPTSANGRVPIVRRI